MRRWLLVATLVAGALPWAASWLVYRGHGIVAVLSWSGLILNSIVDFMLPMCAALATMEGLDVRTEDRALTGCGQ